MKGDAPHVLDVVPAIVAQVLDMAKDMIPQALSNSLLALVLLQDSVPGVSSFLLGEADGNSGLVGEAASRVVKLLPKLTGLNLFLTPPAVVWACAKLEQHHDELLSAVAKRFASRKTISSLSDWGLCAMYGSYQLLDSTDRFTDCAEMLKKELTRRGLSESDVGWSLEGPLDWAWTEKLSEHLPRVARMWRMSSTPRGYALWIAKRFVADRDANASFGYAGRCFVVGLLLVFIWAQARGLVWIVQSLLNMLNDDEDAKKKAEEKKKKKDKRDLCIRSQGHDAPSRPVIIGGGGRRPASVGRLQVEEPSPTTADQEQTLNQLLQPFLKGGAAPTVEQHAIQALQRFLKGAPDLMRRWHGPGSPLVAVSRAGRADVARMLLRAGASANDADSKGVTPLHIAVFDGNADLCKVLLSARADVEAADRHGQTPLFFAHPVPVQRGMASSLPKSNRASSNAPQISGSASFPDLSAFPDMSWTKKRSPKVPQEPPKRFAGPKHVQGYGGHVPRKFNPFAGKHILAKLGVSDGRPEAVGDDSASLGFGMWYGHVGNFPSPVDNWAPAHFVDGRPP
eukprot:s210_g15.t1